MIEASFEDLYEREAQGVFTAAFLLCRDRELAADATQEAFARALARWARLRDQPWVGGWVMRTALNVVRRSLRHRPVLGDPRPGSPDPDERIDLWRCVAGLPRRQQEAVILHYRGDLSVAEIAQITGTREGTVRTHLARARETLRRSLPEGDLYAGG